MTAVVVSELSEYGEGIAFHEGRELYLPLTLIGEKVEVKAGESFVQGSKRAPAEVTAYLEKSRDRTEPFCPHFGCCGGCALQHLSLAGQHAYKKHLIEEALKAAGIVQKAEDFRENVPSFRSKSLRVFFNNAAGRLSTGFYKIRSHEPVEITDCPLEDPRFGPITAQLLDFLNAHKELFAPYDENSGDGLLRHLLLRGGSTDPEDGEVMAVIIARSSLSQQARELLRDFAAGWPYKLYLAFNDERGNAVFGRDFVDLKGAGPLQASLLGLKFKVYPNSFLQVNLKECEHLYRLAIDYVREGASADSKALDLCCGVGTMTLGMAPYFAQVIGLEIVESAILAARENACLNGIANARFAVMDIKDASGLISDPKVTAIIADPARRGLGESARRALCRIRHPLRLALIFCSLTALKRDLPPLIQAGFKLERVQGVDLFAHTMHVETICLLKKDD